MFQINAQERRLGGGKVTQFSDGGPRRGSSKEGQQPDKTLNSAAFGTGCVNGLIGILSVNHSPCR